VVANGCILHLTVGKCWQVLLLCCWLAAPGHAQDGGIISFTQERVIVDEGPSSSLFTPVPIPLLRTGGTSGAVVVSINVSEVRGCVV
jgi:hypothetical protein